MSVLSYGPLAEAPEFKEALRPLCQLGSVASADASPSRILFNSSPGLQQLCIYLSSKV